MFWLPSQFDIITAGSAVTMCLSRRLQRNQIFYQKMRVRSCAYLNNIVEQDHRRVKRRVQPMLGFQFFENARVVISGIEFAEKIKKRQYDLRRLGGIQASHAEMVAARAGCVIRTEIINNSERRLRPSSAVCNRTQ